VSRVRSIDLVVPTVGRVAELERLLGSLSEQTWEGVLRVIVVDQNSDKRLAQVVDTFRGPLSLVHLQSELGVSRASNVGFRHSTADVVGRPDDDCWYPPDALARVAECFQQHADWDALCGITCDESRRPTQLRWDATAGIVSRRNVFRRAIGSTLFVRRSLVETLGDWDESYGPRPHVDGTTWGGSEDGEYILRTLERGFTLGYDPSIRIFHAEFRPSIGDAASMRKAYYYGLEHSRLLEQYGFPRWYPAYRSAQLIAGAAFFLAAGQPGRARFYTAMARGRLAGAYTTTSERLPQT
jgi:glycosyltransferase involved in cell wall biosynthesis